MFFSGPPSKVVRTDDDKTSFRGWGVPSNEIAPNSYTVKPTRRTSGWGSDSDGDDDKDVDPNNADNPWLPRRRVGWGSFDEFDKKSMF